MFIDPSWRILTIGDGDLSFTYSLLKDRKVENVYGSVLDPEVILRAKYREHAIDALLDRDKKIFYQLDITQTQSIPAQLIQQFDLVIFQFPLIPNFGRDPTSTTAPQMDSNILNRHLLLSFIQNCFEVLLDPAGQGLCYITSKDVKPYADWNIENLTPVPGAAHFLGWQPFDSQNFPRYKVRNVDRDKQIKDTAGKTYVWGYKGLQYPMLDLRPSSKSLLGYCKLCGTGPLLTEQSLAAHQLSKSHLRKLNYETKWQDYIKMKV
ncbi:Rossmann-like fold-containing protein [Aliiglaciecola sp. LCG003]|uniref:Rossmann-like fold-containing protein n=1 Tax=Aliiglaciecola sp. LCG003 TaxID=3053655 RepID=UPI0025740385|nr:Rossmann-like fold-containing protein [Aliiglaciecola sp. LCG003]WJG08141.1 DUF2431 domain-containing protein [Aliiglaciecola sp. LCG003]